MADNILEFIAGGFKYAYYTKLDSDGFATGASGTVSAGATSSSPAGRIKAARTAQIQLQAPTTNPVTGDNIVYGTFTFSPDQVPTFTMELAVNNMTFNSDVQGTTTTNVGSSSYSVLQPQTFEPIDLSLWFIRDIKSQQGASVGAAHFETLLIPRVQVYPLGANIAQREVAAFQLQVTINPFSATPMGFTLTEAANSTEVGSYLSWTTEYPLYLEPFKGTGAVTAFGPLTFTPATTSLDDVYVYVEGVRRTAGVTINATTKLVTFDVAPLSNQRVEVWYQHV